MITVPIYKRCDRCGKRLPAGTKCKCSKKRYKHEKIYVDDKIESFYLSKEWRKKREHMIDVYHQLDIYDLYINDVISYGRTMHLKIFIFILQFFNEYFIKYDFSAVVCDVK